MSQEQSKQEEIAKFASFLASVRRFMHEQEIVEVITNPLVKRIVPDSGVDPVKVNLGIGEHYLHTSPEWEMKKLLSNGAGSIYQMATVFRDDLAANWHKPAFLMLEWYEIGINDVALIERCLALFNYLGISETATIVSCRELYLQYTGIDIATVTIIQCKEVCKQSSIHCEGLELPELISSWLTLLWVNLVEPKLTGLMVVKDFPVCQGALSKIVEKPYPHALRFEIFFNGCELANGYHEVTDTDELDQRFANYTGVHPVVSADDIHGMPECSGVSVGIDRLYALIQSRSSLY